MNPDKNSQSQDYYDKDGKRVTPADFQMIITDQDERNLAMKDLKKKLKKADACKSNMINRVKQLATKYAGVELTMERKLEALQKKIIEERQDHFGLRNQKLNLMKKKHAKMDFKDRIRTFP